MTLSDAGEAERFDCVAYSVLSGVAGTNTITGTGPATYSYDATRPPVWFIPANTNTGATTINVTPSGGAALGAKNIFWNGVACVGGELRQNVPTAVLYDGTQFHIIANGFNAPFLDTHAVVVGSADSTKKVRFEVDGLTTATTRVITVPDTDLTLPSAATQSDQETATSTTTYVSPGRQQYHPSAAKAWWNFDGTGTPTFRSQYNCSSITDTGTGNWLVNLTTAFSATTAMTGLTNIGVADYSGHCARGTGSLQNISRTGGGASDAAEVSGVAYGDQ